MLLEKTNEMPKGGLISESFLLWLKISKKGAKSLSWLSEYYPSKEKILRRVIWHLFFWDLSQSEQLSEIKPPQKILGLIFAKSTQNPNLPWPLTWKWRVSQHIFCLFVFIRLTQCDWIAKLIQLLSSNRIVVRLWAIEFPIMEQQNKSAFATKLIFAKNE